MTKFTVLCCIFHQVLQVKCFQNPTYDNLTEGHGIDFLYIKNIYFQSNLTKQADVQSIYSFILINNGNLQTNSSGVAFSCLATQLQKPAVLAALNPICVWSHMCEFITYEFNRLNKINMAQPIIFQNWTYPFYNSILTNCTGWMIINIYYKKNNCQGLLISASLSPSTISKEMKAINQRPNGYILNPPITLHTGPI